MFNLRNITKFTLTVSISLTFAAIAFAQTTAFTYQGRFTDSTLPQPTSGSYEMQYKLFDTATVGTGSQNGITLTLPSVAVVNGIFTVQLDFGGGAFRANSIFVEIGVRPVGSAAAFTVLGPRQQITAAPLAVRSGFSDVAITAGDSLALGGIPANQFVQTSDSRLADDRNPLAGSPNYIQNQTAVSQPADIKISGNATIGGTVSGNAVNTGTQFNLGGNRFLSGGGGNVFAGLNSGIAATTGGDNAFVGTNSGMINTTGFNNSFFGTDAGRTNNGASNSFFGRSAGFANTTGNSNSFFGLDAGRFNTTGDQNAFFGIEAGRRNTGGINNTFSGGFAGFNNLTGGDNTFVGLNSGFNNTIGSNNAFVGRNAGENNTTGSTNSFFGNFAGATNITGSNNSALGNGADIAGTNFSFATAIGAGSWVTASNTIALGRLNGSDTVRIFGLGTSGSLVLCRNALNQVSTCTTAAFGGSFIENSTALQALSNFNVSGNGTVGGTVSGNIVNSATNFRIGGTTVFSTPNATSVVIGQSANHGLTAINSTFVGFKAGQAANSFSQANTFIGSEAGESNTAGGNNSFVGKDAGFFNTTGSFNSFFGSGAGVSNKTASDNSFFGYQAGVSNTLGTRNSFFGSGAGQSGINVDDNSFFGYLAGSSTTGGNNSFFGSSAGVDNDGGTNNTFVGNKAGFINTSGNRNTFIGSQAGDTLMTGNDNTLVGYQADSSNGKENTVIGSSSSVSGNQNTLLGEGSFITGDGSIAIGQFTKVAGDANIAIGNGARVQPFTPGFPGPTNATAIGSGAVANFDNTVVLGRAVDFVKIPGKLNVDGTFFANTAKISSLEITASTKLTAISSSTNNGSIPLCRNGNNLLSECPSNFAGYANGLTKEQITQIETQTEQIKQQQTKIAAQAEQIKLMQMQMEALKAIVCSQNPNAEFCKENKK